MLCVRNAHAIIFVYDVTSKESFDHLIGWLDEAEHYLPQKDVVKVLVGNKVDEARVVSAELAEKWSAMKGMEYFETSAKAEEGVDLLFDFITKKVMH